MSQRNYLTNDARCRVTISYRGGAVTVHESVPEDQVRAIEDEMTWNPDILSILVEYQQWPD